MCNCVCVRGACVFCMRQQQQQQFAVDWTIRVRSYFSQPNCTTLLRTLLDTYTHRRKHTHKRHAVVKKGKNILSQGFVVHDVRAFVGCSQSHPTDDMLAVRFVCTVEKNTHPQTDGDHWFQYIFDTYEECCFGNPCEFQCFTFVLYSLVGCIRTGF